MEVVNSARRAEPSRGQAVSVRDLIGKAVMS
jgi:hypothetical protein